MDNLNEDLENNAKMQENSLENDEKIKNNAEFEQEQTKLLQKRNKVSEKTRADFRLAWGNINALILFGGNIILWGMAILFSLKTYNLYLEEKTTATICLIMLVVFAIFAVVALVLFIMSLVLFVKNLKENKAKINDKEMQ